MISNTGLVAGVIVGLALLVAGLFLWNRSAARGGPGMVTLGGLLVLAAEVYGLIVLRPFVGRPYDDNWQAQIATVESLAMLGMLLCAAGVVAHALSLPRAPRAPH